MKAALDVIPEGTVTSPAGFFAGATFAGIKKKAAANILDLGLLFSEAPCTAAGVFTRNRIKAAPVVLSRRRLIRGRATAVVASSGCANAGTGRGGSRDAARMAALAARGLGVPPADVLVASTGVIGQRLPMRRISRAMSRIAVSRDGGHELARAIMTTDTVPKETAVAVRHEEGSFTIGGIAKGSGMIHPNMGTLLCFVATDAPMEVEFLREAMRRAVDVSFNMVTVDGDTSPNDTALVLANGRAGGRLISRDSGLAPVFEGALSRVCISLARSIAADGEGATRLIEVRISGARSIRQARLAARTVAGSSLVKAAVHGADPNWGRIVAALGRSGAQVVERRIDLDIGGIPVLAGGESLGADEVALSRALQQREVPISVRLNLGEGEATAWGCDLSAEYVAINSRYMT